MDLSLSRKIIVILHFQPLPISIRIMLCKLSPNFYFSQGNVHRRIKYGQNDEHRDSFYTIHLNIPSSDLRISLSQDSATCRAVLKIDEPSFMDVPSKKKKLI